VQRVHAVTPAVVDVMARGRGVDLERAGSEPRRVRENRRSDYAPLVEAGVPPGRGDPSWAPTASRRPRRPPLSADKGRWETNNYIIEVC